MLYFATTILILVVGGACIPSNLNPSDDETELNVRDAAQGLVSILVALAIGGALITGALIVLS